MKLKASQSSIIAIVFFGSCYGITMLRLIEDTPSIMSLLFLIGITALNYTIIKNYAVDKNDAFCFWISYIAKIAYAVFRFITKYKSDMVYPTLSADARRFWNQAMVMYNGGHVNPDTRFPYVLSLEFKFFGQNVLCFVTLNIFLTMMMMIIVMKILNKLEVHGTARFISLVAVGLLPYEIIVSCSVLRESIYFIFITLSFYMYYRYIVTKKFKYMLFAILVMLPVILLHVGYFPIVFVYFYDSFKNDKTRTTKDLLLRFFIILSMVAVIIFSIRIDASGAGYMSRGISGLISKITGESSGGYSDEAGSRYLSGLTINSVPQLILYTPIRWIYFLFSPLPTNWRGFTDIAAFLLDGCVHFYVIFSTMRAVKKINSQRIADRETADKKRILTVGLGIVALIALMFCLNTSTAGTAIRHRDVLIGVEAVIIGLSYEIRKHGVRYEEFYK